MSSAEWQASEQLTRGVLQLLERDLDIAGRGGTSLTPKLRKGSKFIQWGFETISGEPGWNSSEGLFGLFLDGDKDPMSKTEAGYWMYNPRRILLIGVSYSLGAFKTAWNAADMVLENRTIVARGSPTERFKISDAQVAAVGNGAGVKSTGVSIVPLAMAAAYYAPEGLPVATSQSAYGAFDGGGLRSRLGAEFRSNQQAIFGSDYDHLLVDDLIETVDQPALRQCGTVQVGFLPPQISMSPGSGVVASAGGGWKGNAVGQKALITHRVPIVVVLGVQQSVAWASTRAVASVEVSRRVRQIVSWIQGRQRVYTQWTGTYATTGLRVVQVQHKPAQLSGRPDVIYAVVTIEIRQPYTTQVV